MTERKDTASILASQIAEVFVSTFKELNTEAYVHIALKDGRCLRGTLHREGQQTLLRPCTIQEYLSETRANQDNPDRRTYRL